MVLSTSYWLDELHGPSILSIFESLAKLGYQVKVLLPSTSKKLIQRQSFSVLSLKHKKKYPLFNLVSKYKSFLKFIFQERPTTLIFDCCMIPLFLLAKLLYKSEGILLVLSRPIGLKGFKGLLSSMHFRVSLILAKSFVKTIFSVGTLELGRLGNIPKHKIIDVPPPLGEHFLKLNPPIDKDQVRLKLGLGTLLRNKVLLYHGVLYEQRGILEVLEVFANSYKGDNEITLLLVGDGPAKNPVKNFIQNNKIKNIVFQGRVPYPKIPEIIVASDIGLVLLPDHPWWRYQVPTKLIELLGMGKPVIASDLPGIRWIAGNSPSVIYLKTLTVSAFKEAVKKALIKKDIEVSQKLIDRFSSYSIAIKLSQVISTCFDRND